MHDFYSNYKIRIQLFIYQLTLYYITIFFSSEVSKPQMDIQHACIDLNVLSLIEILMTQCFPRKDMKLRMRMKMSVLTSGRGAI